MIKQKLTKLSFFTTKIIENCSKLTKKLLKRRIEQIKLNQIKKLQKHHNLLHVSELSEHTNKLTHQ